MSQYTTELKNVVEIVDDELVSLFDLLNGYPIFDETYRDTLNKKIVKHYYFHEIGFETAERFTFEINRKMDEIMVEYNQLYASEISINPLVNFRKSTSLSATSEDVENETLNVTGTREDTREMAKETIGQQDTENASAGTTQDKIKDVKSDTPTNVLLAGDLEANLYASEVTVNDNLRESNQSTTQGIAENQNESSTETDSSDLTSDTVKENEKSNTRSEFVNDEGITISESELLMRYRETFLNIDLNIITELRTMFMLIV